MERRNGCGVLSDSTVPSCPSFRPKGSYAEVNRSERSGSVGIETPSGTVSSVVPPPSTVVSGDVSDRTDPRAWCEDLTPLGAADPHLVSPGSRDTPEVRRGPILSPSRRRGVGPIGPPGSGGDPPVSSVRTLSFSRPRPNGGDRSTQRRRSSGEILFLREGRTK